jgi:hypothetical protein
MVFVLEPGKPNCRYHRESGCSGLGTSSTSPRARRTSASARVPRFGAEAPAPTDDPRVAHSDVTRREPVKPIDWPL